MSASSPSSLTVPELLREQAHRFGQREALVSPDWRLTYQELHRSVRDVAHSLHALGVRRGDHVAILMGNRPEWVLTFLAVQCLGAVAVALNTWATARELSYALAHAEVSTLVSVDRFRNADYRSVVRDLNPGRGDLARLRRIVWLAADSRQPVSCEPGSGEMDWNDFAAMHDKSDGSALEAAAHAVQPDDIGMLLYTSGSTAAPKGILLQHRHWIHNAFEIGQRQQVSEQDRLWLAVSLFWSFGCVNALPNLLTHGGCVVLQEHFDADQALALIESERCTLVYGTPNMIQALHAQQERQRADLRSLRSGAMIGTPEQIRLAVALGARDICNVYGLSETYGNCTVTAADEPIEVRVQTVGRPLPGVQIRICDLVTGEQVHPGADGEIRVRGPLFKSYFKDPVQTREAFDDQGFFRTGDLGQVDTEGRLYYRGRLKEMVKSGGINIAPKEVEEALMRHPTVQTAYVIGIPDPKLDEALVAIVIPAPGAIPDAVTLKAHCRAELAAYKVPSAFHFTTEDALPLTTTGKVQKMHLHRLLGGPSARATA